MSAMHVGLTPPDSIRFPVASPAVLVDAQILAEERQYMVLKAVGHGARMGARIDLECMGDAVVVENLVQLACAGLEAVLVAYVDRNAPVWPKTADILVDEDQRRIRGPLREHVLLGGAVLHRQIEIERRI